MATQRRPATEAEAKALASATRIRILRLCLDEALTNKEIAGRLGAHPATVLHHVRTLVTAGFLAPEQPRRGNRGAREVPYRATGKSWTLDVGDSAISQRGEATRAMVDAFRQELQLVQDPSQVRLYRLGLRLTAAEHAELTGWLAEWLDGLAARRRGRSHGRPYSMFVAIHPDPGREAVTPPAAS